MFDLEQIKDEEIYVPAIVLRHWYFYLCILSEFLLDEHYENTSFRVGSTASSIFEFLKEYWIDE